MSSINASLEQGAQVSTAIQRVETTTRHQNTEKIGGDTHQPLYSPMPTKKKGRGRRGRGNLPHKSKIWSSQQLQNFPEQVQEAAWPSG